jgi:DNA repair protein RecN (Recombination protein N)
LLKQLIIKNFALIEELEATFSSGMTCITGETGTGKSILLGGLSLVLGKRADLSSLLDPNKKCVVEASFQIEEYALKTLFESLDVDYEDYTVLRREILPQGKSRAFINDTPVNLADLEKISLNLIDIHSQNETNALLENEYQFQVLDALANNKEILLNYQRTRLAYITSKKQYQKLKLASERAKASFELDEFLYNELIKLNIKGVIQEDLESKHSSLIHVDFLRSTLAEAVQIMENESTGLLDQILKIRSLVSGLIKKSGHFNSLQQRFNTLFIEAEDLLDDCKIKFENLETNPEELDKIQLRLDQLNRLMQKHKVNSVSELIKIQNELEKSLTKTSKIDSELESLQDEEKKHVKSLTSLAYKLTESRKESIKILKKELENLVQKMGMTDAAFKIELEPSELYLANGSDQLNFLFKSNKGSQFKQLKKIVSGGELSRIMLAIKAILSSYVKLPTLIFDEIDTGVSGKISNSIAEVMVSMGKKIQLINITHLPQVAAKGDYHFKVLKKELNGKTLTQLFSLNKEARIEEIAMMLSGNKVTPTAIAHAKQLMN